jgi:uncharacterized membrane protein
MCHASEVYWPGIAVAPKGVMLDTDRRIALHAREIYLQAGVTHAMPPGNLSFIEEQERAAIRDWYRAVTEGML